jgi:hypothetical protein
MTDTSDEEQIALEKMEASKKKLEEAEAAALKALEEASSPQ